MKLKLIIFISCFLMLFTSLSISSFALEPDQYGSNFDTSHQENSCCEDTDGVVHYNQGYEDGLLDGAPTQEEIDSYKQEAIDSYLTDDAYLSSLSDYYTEAYQDGEKSKQSELETEILNQYQNGFDGGYQVGYAGAYEDAKEQMYALGVADGKAEFRNDTEYTLTKQAYLDKGYELGYLEGHEDGYEDGKGNSINPATLFGIIFTIFALVIVLLIATYFTSKKKRK